MNAFLAIPIALRLTLMFGIGVVVAGLLNLGVYRLAWRQRTLSPWGPTPQGLAPRGWLDRLPMFGWLRLRREAAVHGPAFWLRPLLVELLTGAAFAGLYWWEIQHTALLPRHFAPAPMFVANLAPPWELVQANSASLLHQALLAHLIFVSLMLVASLIDIDEKSIPDEITVPGTLLGLALATVLPWSLLPGQLIHVVSARGVVEGLEFLHATCPAPWPAAFEAAPRISSLAVALGCYAMWCFALLPRTWYGRHGVRRALNLCLARIARERASRLIFVLAFLGTGGILGVWLRGGPAWAGLLSSLLGVAAGGGIIWAVRLIGAAVMRREAMGFGDVTLMAMIGAYVGWQPCLLIFFLAPLAGVFLGVGQWLLRRGQEIPYGPFLCLGTLVIILAWSRVWADASNYFELLGGILPLLILGCLALMAVLLWLLQIAKRLVLGIEE